ncbi:MAG TPA: hypothetical protein VK003_17645 [Oceanobacillus sp.]|nr:hypothetical protein [Oceanobacillus sp.]
MQRIMLVLIACVLLTTMVSAAPPLQEEAAGTPQITAFTTTASGVSREDLINRTARVPVAWTTENRPLTSNLVFEQVLPNGATVNAELPRLLPWVVSNGQGVAAPISPGYDIDEIVLRVRLVNLFSGDVLSERQLTLPVVQGGSSGSVGDRPSITVFTTTATYVNEDSLENGTARIPVTWTTVNRPPTANLVFEQVLADGSLVNVELPRDNPFVPPSGNGMTAPVPPGDGSTTVTLRVSMFDLVNGRVYDLRELTIPVLPEGTTPTPTPTATPMIRFYRVNAENVSSAELAAGTARITVSWEVANRPPNSNLFFEQILSDGRVVNIELPRPDPIVNSSGDGLIAPVAPGGDAQSIQLSLSLVGLDNFRLYDQEIVTLPIVTQTPTPTGEPFNLTFSTTVSSVSRQELAMGTARIPVSWSVSPRPVDTNLYFEQVLPDGSTLNVELPRSNPIVNSSGNGVVAPILPSGQNVNQIVVRVRLASLSGPTTLAQRELIIPITGTTNVTPSPRRFIVTTPNTSIAASQFASGPVINVISWDVSQRPPNSNLVFEQVMPNGIGVNAELPRPDPIVPSSGTGAVRLLDPGNNIAEVRVRVRLINLGDNSTIDQREITLSITGRSGSGGAAVETTAEATAEPVATEAVACEFNWLISTISGCPAEAPQQVAVTVQTFENGLIVGRTDGDTLYFLSNSGTVVVDSRGTAGSVTEPPAGLQAPAPEYSAFWDANQELMGWATGPQGSYIATWQRGIATETQDIYLSLPDGRIARLSGPTNSPNSWVAIS